MSNKPILVFIGCFIVIYGVLITPWPGWNEIYGQYFRSLAGWVFGRDEGGLVVTFKAHVMNHGFSTLGTQMILGNRYLIDSAGNGTVREVELDTRSIGWVPTALTIALIAASPIPWKRRIMALLIGLVLVHLFILFSLQVEIWDEYPALSLATFSPWFQRILDELDYTLLTQIGASFSVPVIIWALVTFCGRDAALFKSAASDTRAEQQPG